MTTDFQSRRTLVLRFGRESIALGRVTKQLDTNTSVIYNGYPHIVNFVDECVRTAAEHDGKVIVPIQSQARIKTLDICSHMLLIYRNQWMLGDIAYSGGRWTRRGVDDTLLQGTGFHTPDMYQEDSAILWVALDNVTSGDDLDLTGWMADRWIDGKQEPFDSFMKRSSSCVTTAYAPATEDGE